MRGFKKAKFKLQEKFEDRYGPQPNQAESKDDTHIASHG